jgi:O-antigen/teichoic acid export membrane protein
MSLTGVHSIARNTAQLTAAQLVGFAARTIYVVLVARLLGPELYGLLAYSQSWYLAFLPLALFGLGPAMVHLVAGDRAQAPEVAARALAIRVLMTAIASVACIVVAWRVAPDPRAPTLISILVLALAGRAITAWAMHLYTAFEATHHALRQELVFRLLDLAVAATVLLAGGSIFQLVALNGIVWLAQATWALGVVRRHFVPLRIDWRPAGWRPLVTLALPFLVTAAAVDWRAYGTLILYRNLTDDAVLFSQLALAMQALFITAALPQSLVAAAQPVLTRSAARGDGKDLAWAGAIQRLAFIVGATSGLVGMAAGPDLFRLVLGDAYVHAGQLAGLTLWCLLPLMAGIGYGPVLVARGQLYLQMAASISGAVVMTATLPPLAQAFGERGVILAAALGFTLPPLLIFSLAVRRGWTDWRATLFRPAVTVLAALGVYLALEPRSAWLALPSALLALWAGALLLGVLTRDERQLLIELRREGNIRPRRG